MADHQGQIFLFAMMLRGSILISAIIFYSLAYAILDIMDDDNFATALEDQILISAALIGMVRKSSIQSIIMAK